MVQYDLNSEENVINLILFFSMLSSVDKFVSLAFPQNFNTINKIGIGKCKVHIS